MRKQKVDCHICQFTMATGPGQETPNYCELCGTSISAPNTETQVLTASVAKHAGGIEADSVDVILTNKRIIFTGDKKTGNYAFLGWLLGGLIGGLIAEALNKNTGKKIAFINFDDAASFDAETKDVSGKNTRPHFTITGKDGTTYSFQLKKKEIEEWEAAIRKHF